MFRRYLGLIAASLLLFGCGSQSTAPSVASPSPTSALATAPSAGPSSLPPTSSPEPADTGSGRALAGLVGEAREDIVSDLEAMGYVVMPGAGPDGQIGLHLPLVADVHRASTVFQIFGDPVTKVSFTVGNLEDLQSVADWTLLLVSHDRADVWRWLTDSLTGIGDVPAEFREEAVMGDGALASIYLTSVGGFLSLDVTLSTDGTGAGP